MPMFTHLRRSRLTTTVFVAFAAGWMGSFATAQPEIATGNDKISPELQWRQSIKERYATSRSNRLATTLVELGMDTAVLDVELCAIYVDEPFTPQQASDLRQNGIDLKESTYVPPIPGRHPHGAYLAWVDHSAFAQARAITNIVKVNSAGRGYSALNDVSSVITDTSSVRLGLGVSKNTGKGVRIGVADTGIDLSHPDFPTPFEAYDVTDGDSVATWGLDVSNTVSSHGTHVAGSAVGRGFASGFAYSGSAPGAELCFYKIGNDSSGSASLLDIAEAINRASEIGCDIFSLSFGGIGSFNDGSGFVEQTLDFTYSQGMLSFSSAGNAANDDLHVTIDCPANSTSEIFRLTIDNSDFDQPFEFSDFIQMNWIDTPGDLNLNITLLNVDINEDPSAILFPRFYDFSDRGTEIRFYEFAFAVPPNEIKTYEFAISNNADEDVQAQVFALIGFDTVFEDPDVEYTVGSPAVADTVIAVGSVNQRTRYKNYMGDEYSFVNSIGELLKVSHFSSRGPRIDGVMKPDIVAPGAMTISCRDGSPNLANSDFLIVDNDGVDLNGSGPAQYYISAGTSMACPTAAGAAALLVEAHPFLDVEALHQSIIKNASQANAPDIHLGYGIIAAKQSILHGPRTGVTGDIDGDSAVGVEDLSILIDMFGGNNDLADINDDRTVDTADLGMLIRNFGMSVSSAP